MKYKESISKSVLIHRLFEKNPVNTLTDVKLAVDILLEQFTETLATGERIEVRGFGTFSLRYHPPCLTRNPKTGEEIKTPAKYRIHFKPGKEFRHRVNNKGG